MATHNDFLNDLEDTDDGHFNIEEQGGRAVLMVTPPGKKGKVVRIMDVLARLKLFDLSGFDKNRLEEIISLADGQAHDICPWNFPERVDATFQIQLDDDLMEAQISIAPPTHGGRPVDRESIITALHAVGVMHGIKEDVIEEILAGAPGDGDSVALLPGQKSEAKLPSAPRTIQAVIAVGEQPRAGRDEVIKHAFNPNPRAVPKIEPGQKRNARVDFKNLDVIQSCEADMLLAELEVAIPGVPGCNVKGEELAPPRTEGGSLEAGRNVRVAEDGRSLFSQIAGQVRIREMLEGRKARIDVEEILELEDVDFSTGHVDFPGTVLIRGTVLDGFSVKATGDIVVEKSVGNVQLKAGGDVVLSGGVVSRTVAGIQAGGDIIARYVQNASLNCHGSVFIEVVAMQSRIVAGGDILIEGGRGELIGGMALCGRLLRAVKLGSQSETPTLITVGLNPEMVEQLELLENDYREKLETLDKVRLHISQIEEAQKHGRSHEENQEETLKKLKLIEQKYQGLVDNLESQREKIFASVQPNPEAYVEAEEGLFPGVTISFGGGVKKYVRESRPVHEYSRFVIEDGQVVLRHSDI